MQVDCTGIHKAKFVTGQVKPSAKNVSSLYSLYNVRLIQPVQLTSEVNFEYIVNEGHLYMK